MKTFKQYFILKEEYFYMYHKIIQDDIDKMSLYDALVLAHDIDYKWMKLRHIRPQVESVMYRVLKMIYNKYKDLMINTIEWWLYSHHISSDINRYLTDVEYNPGLMINNVLFEPQIYKNTIKYLHGLNIKNAVNDEPSINQKQKYRKIISNKSFLENYLKDIKNDSIFGQIYKILEILKNKESEKDINKIMHAITISLNLKHQLGNMITDYSNNLSKEQLDKLSNLPTYQWDKELEQEFGI